MLHKDKSSKRRFNTSGSHFSMLKKSPSLSSATVVGSTLFKSPNSHHRGATNYMRRSQGPEMRQLTRHREEHYKTKQEVKKDNEYGLKKDGTQKYENSKPHNGKIYTYRSVDNFMKVQTLSKISEDEEKSKIVFRRMRSVRKSPGKKQSNPLKQSCSTQNTHRHARSPATPSQEELNQLNKIIETLSQSAVQYRDLYEKSKYRLESAEKEVSQEKVKYQRIKNIYKERINQLVKSKEIGKPNFGHLFTYQQFPKDFLPDSIIVQNSLDCSIADATKDFELELENYSKISNLSLESH